MSKHKAVVKVFFPLDYIDGRVYRVGYRTLIRIVAPVPVGEPGSLPNPLHINWSADCSWQEWSSPVKYHKGQLDAYAFAPVGEEPLYWCAQQDSTITYGGMPFARIEASHAWSNTPKMLDYPNLNQRFYCEAQTLIDRRLKHAR